MKIRDLFDPREAALFPSVAGIVARETAAARKAFPNAKSDAEALALSHSAFRRNMDNLRVRRDGRNRAQWIMLGVIGWFVRVKWRVFGRMA
jgi:hypothetical protein